ncbi:MAG: hypothetical protein ACK4ZY_09555 [Sphingomonas sp.]
MTAALGVRPGMRARGLGTRGVALTEFAFTLPFFLVLLLYGLETANYGLAV